ncbi:MAG: TonB-dependent receptor [Bacteroidales bacterium]|nr:TonB-dependent receptor [Bacteroidales bacterium]
MKILKIIIISIFFSSGLIAQNYSVSGYIRDNDSGEELLYSTVYVEEINKGFSTNQYGFYSITLPKGDYTLVYSFMGFHNQVEKINLNKNQNLNVSLINSDQDIGEVIVTGQNSDHNVKSSEVSTIDLNVKEARLIPILFGEQDVLKTIQLMPGVSPASEGSSGFYVRGGNSDQNLILLDEAPVYNASHLLGFFSVFNSDALNDMKMYKGGIPARYGGRLSSVTDIRMKNGNLKRWEAAGGIGLISSRLTVEGPIIKDKASLMVSGRRTYADILVKNFKKEYSDLTLYFYDLNIKTNFVLSPKDRIYLSGYFGRDVFGLEAFGFDWGNKTATLRWNHIFNNKLFMNTTAIYSDFDYGFQVEFNKNVIGFSAGVYDYNLKQDFTWFLSPQNSVKFGWQSIYHNFKPMSFEVLEKNPEDTLNSINDTSLVAQYALESSFYISNEQKIGDRITILYGTRFNIFNNIGPFETKTYDENNQVVTSVLHKENEFYYTHFNWEPRINATFLVNETTSFKASYNRTVQHLHLLSNSTSSSPTDLWMPSSEYVKPEKGDQWAVGVFKNFFDNKFELSVEGFYRQLYNQVDFEDGAQVMFNPDVEAEIVLGKGRAYGAEFLLRKKAGKLTGWLSYTLLKSERSFDEIQNGEWFSARQDRTHDISVVVTYQILPKLNFSTSWVYYTGDAVTFPAGKYYIDGVLINLYTNRNADRMPDYHRLDFGLTWIIKDSDKFYSDLGISVYNAYNRKNAYTITFSENGQTGQTEAERLALFGAVPSISWNFRF